MKWTDKKPNSPGWYWYFHHTWSAARCLEVFRDGHYWWASTERVDPHEWQYIENFDGQWAGPIVAPELPE